MVEIGWFSSSREREKKKFISNLKKTQIRIRTHNSLHQYPNLTLLKHLDPGHKTKRSYTPSENRFRTVTKTRYGSKLLQKPDQDPSKIAGPGFERFSYYQIRSSDVCYFLRIFSESGRCREDSARRRKERKDKKKTVLCRNIPTNSIPIQITYCPFEFCLWCPNKIKICYKVIIFLI